MSLKYKKFIGMLFRKAQIWNVKLEKLSRWFEAKSNKNIESMDQNVLNQKKYKSSKSLGHFPCHVTHVAYISTRFFPTLNMEYKTCLLLVWGTWMAYYETILYTSKITIVSSLKMANEK
jgi:hypothetical protein